MPKPPNLSNPIAAIRARLGMKQPEFAEFVGCGLAMLKQIESGRKKPALHLIENICAKCGVPVEAMVPGRTPDQIAALLDRPPRKFPSLPAMAASLLPEMIAHALLVMSIRSNAKEPVLPFVLEVERTKRLFGVPPQLFDELAAAVHAAIPNEVIAGIAGRLQDSAINSTLRRARKLSSPARAI